MPSPHAAPPDNPPAPHIGPAEPDVTVVVVPDAGGTRRIGPHRLVRELGSGGMGTVYLATRAEGGFEQKVAIKLIKQAGSEEVLRYFQRERQILARLEHPNIARLLDGGTTEDGQPYFVMEYIRGETILSYCRTRKLTVRERLELFLGVCVAVQYAHANLVVHRDLKPGNVLITSEGVPKLLDFGIAKLLTPSGSASDLTAAAPAMTMAYASPEQLRGEPVTTATDVYSLGVLLYELLADCHPYRTEGISQANLMRSILEHEPTPPSAASTTRPVDATPSLPSADSTRLRHQLEGDLDTIVLTAMRKEAARRYPSVEALAADIRRHLAGFPVSARRPTVGYLVGRFVHRNRLPVALGGAAAGLLLAFAVTASLQAARIARERDRSERVGRFLIELFKSSDPRETKGKVVTARELLDRGTARLEHELGEEPEVQASLLYTLGDVYLSLDLADQAVPLLERALALRRRSLGPTHPDVARTLGLLGRAQSQRGNLAEAERTLQQALALLDRTTQGEEVARDLARLGGVRQRGGDLAGAEARYREAIDLLRRTPGSDPDLLATLTNDLAVNLAEKGDAAGADALLAPAIAEERRSLGADHPTVLLALGQLAFVRLQTGDNAGAERAAREALPLARKVLGEDHATVGTIEFNLAEALYNQKKYAEAEPLYREVLATWRRTLGPDHTDIAYTLRGLGNLLVAQDRAVEAEPLLRESLAIFERKLPPGHWTIGVGLRALGTCLAARGEDREAEKLLLRAYEIFRARSPDDALTRDAAAVLVWFYEEHGRSTDAARFRQAGPADKH